MTESYAPPWLADVENTLYQIHHEELCAVLNSDRKTIIACRLAWADLYTTAYGASGVRGSRDGELVERIIREHASVFPRWLLEKRARPLVKVKRRKEYRVKFNYDREALWYREWLSCGHVIDVPAGVFEPKPAKRRRCVQCAREKCSGIATLSRLKGEVA